MDVKKSMHISKWLRFKEKWKINIKTYTQNNAYDPLLEVEHWLAFKKTTSKRNNENWYNDSQIRDSKIVIERISFTFWFILKHLKD